MSKPKPKNEPLRTFTPRDREQAILICSVAASNPDLTEDYDTTANLLGLLALEDEFGETVALDLALDAWTEVAKGRRQTADPDPEVDAEAECLLREGWCPS